MQAFRVCARSFAAVRRRSARRRRCGCNALTSSRRRLEIGWSGDAMDGMTGEPRPYGFRPVVEADLVMLRRWLATSDVVRWWGDPDHEVELMRRNLTDAAVAMWIVEHRGRPFAYVQDFDLHAWWPDHPFIGLPPDCRGIDQFIGEPNMLGRGHGSGFVRAIAERLLAGGASCVSTDPDPENIRACRAYEKAGFVAAGTYHTESEVSLLMIRWGRSRDSAGARE
jgi:aminoglycoside 6'-N-acetyltransferase